MSKAQQKSPADLLTKEDYERVSPLEKDLKPFKSQSDPRFDMHCSTR